MNTSGFNLLELCICMSIAIILSSSCYYGYQQHQHEFERRQAELTLQDIALNLQEHEDIKTGYSALQLNTLGFSNIKNDYEYTLNTSSTEFTIQARPLFKDSCDTLTLNQAGIRKSNGNIKECWN